MPELFFVPIFIPLITNNLHEQTKQLYFLG